MARYVVAYALGCALILASAGTPGANAASSPLPAAAASVAPTVVLNEFSIKTPNSGARYLTKGPDGALWFTQFDANQIGRIATDGSVLEFPLRGDAHPSVITTGPDGNVWFTETSPPAAIAMMTPKGTLKRFRLRTDYAGPVGIVAGPDGNLWFTEFTVDKIGRITPDGTITEFALPPAPAPATSPGSSGTPPPPKGATEITVGPDSNLWFTEQNANQIGRITPSGAITEFPLVADNNYPTSIVVGPDKNIWFTEVGTGKIGRMTIAGAVTSYAIPTRHSGPSSITVGPDNNIWFTETNVNQIAKIHAKSGKITEVPLPSPDSGPFGITTGPDNALWFVESKSNKVARYTP
jgi:streptogramin lyase